MNLLLSVQYCFRLALRQQFFLRKKNKTTADTVLAIWLIFLGLDYLRSYFIFEKDILFLLGFGYTLPALNAPFLFVYVYFLTSPKAKFNPKKLLHLIPFVLYNLYLASFLYFKSPAERYDFFHETSLADRPLLFKIFEGLMIIIMPVYVVGIVRYLRKHLQDLRNRFSCRDKIDLSWVNYLLISVVVLWTVIIVTKIVTGYYNDMKYNDTLLTMYYFELIIIVIIGYFGFHQEVILGKFYDPNIKDKQVKKYSSSGLSEDGADLARTKLINFMDQEKPYLISDLTLDKLSEMVHIPAHHISQVINDKLDKNFYEFVNHYRVKEVKRLIEENHGEKYTLLSIAHDSGFNSKSTFNSIFKKYTHLTPKEYMNQVNLRN
ncbi:MAG: helix-turn-helix domain-containing protein [Bacteroidales bacterium]